MFDGHERPNATRFVFLDDRAREFCLDWDLIPRDVVATLRSAAGRNPYDRELSDLVGEPATRSEDLRQHWAKHDVCLPISGVKRFHHVELGRVELNCDAAAPFPTPLKLFPPAPPAATGRRAPAARTCPAVRRSPAHAGGPSP